jgi:hypothetical protein
MLRSKLYIFLVIFLYLSCKEEEETPILTYNDLLLLNSRFECIMPSFEPSTYFKGKIGEKELCYYEGVGDLYTINKVFSNTMSITTTPELNLNANNPNSRRGNSLGLYFYRSDGAMYETSLSLSSAFSTQDSTMKQYIDKYFLKPSITILDKANAGEASHENKEGIAIYIYTYLRPGESMGMLSTIVGKQSPDSYIKVKKAEKGVLFGKTYYDIVLDIKCDLFKHWESKPSFYGVLEGEYATRLIYE